MQNFRHLYIDPYTSKMENWITYNNLEIHHIPSEVVFQIASIPIGVYQSP